MEWRNRETRWPIVHVGEVEVGGGDIRNGFVSKRIDRILRVVVLNHIGEMNITA